MSDAGETLVRSSELAQALRERDEARADVLRALRAASRVTLETQSAEEAMTAVLALLDEARHHAYVLAVAWKRREFGEVEAKARDAALLHVAPATREPPAPAVCETCGNTRKVWLCECGWAVIRLQPDTRCDNCGGTDSLTKKRCPDCAPAPREG